MPNVSLAHFATHPGPVSKSATRKPRRWTISSQIIVQLLLLLLTACSVNAAEPTAGDRWVAKANQQDITDIQRHVYLLLEKVQTCDFSRSHDQWSVLNLYIPDSSGKPNALKGLYDLGFDAIPSLVEALDDLTPTKTAILGYTTPDGTYVNRIRVWKVNEMVAFVIRNITRREFVLGEWGDGANLSANQQLTREDSRVSEADT